MVKFNQTMKKITFYLLLTLILAVVIQSCKKDKMKNNDKDLYAEISENSYVYYQNGKLLNGVSPSPHGSFKLRFNAVALAALDSLGELPKGASFPTGSMLVKEVYENEAVPKGWPHFFFLLLSQSYERKKLLLCSHFL